MREVKCSICKAGMGLSPHSFRTVVKYCYDCGNKKMEDKK